MGVIHGHAEVEGWQRQFSTSAYVVLEDRWYNARISEGLQIETAFHRNIQRLLGKRYLTASLPEYGHQSIDEDLHLTWSWWTALRSSLNTVDLEDSMEYICASLCVVWKGLCKRIHEI